MEDLNQINIVSISDIHMGNIKVSPKVIYERLQTYVYPKLSTAHILFICGDFFDNLFDLNSKTAYYTNRIILDLQEFALQYNLKIRILRGTYLHDREQCSLFLSMKDNNTNIDIQYFNSIDIEYIKQYNLYVLYLPDNLPYKNSFDVLTIVHKKLKELSIDKIDLAIVHGYFEHMLPREIVGTHKSPPCVYTYNEFSKIVNGCVLVGHVHTSSIYKNIIYNGSFDRLAHGEEEKKGYFYLTKNINGKFTYNFIENKEATIFATIFIDTEDAKEAIKLYDEQINKKFHIKEGYVRVCIENQVIKDILLKHSARVYPNIIFKSKSLIKKQNIEMCAPIDFDEDLTIPNEDNLAEMSYLFLKEKKIIPTHISKNDIIDIITKI